MVFIHVIVEGFLTLIFRFKIGYVEQIKYLLFTMTKQERETMREKYKAKIPEPLTNQFPERASKNTAVRRHQARKQLQTELFPSGIIFLSICIKSKTLIDPVGISGIL